MRGETYRRIERYDDALSDFDRAIELEPQDAFTLASRGETYRRIERYDDALRDLNRAIELNSEADWAFYSVALVYRALDQKADMSTNINKAIHLAEQSYEANPQDWSSAVSLALYSLVAGETGSAKQLYEKVLSVQAPPHIINEAINDLDDFLALVPDHAQARHFRDLLWRNRQQN